jgi:serine carboxypeptidase 1
MINRTAMQSKEAFDQGDYRLATNRFFSTQYIVDYETSEVDFYNVLEKQRGWNNIRKSRKDLIEILQKGASYQPKKALSLDEIMDLVHEALELPPQAYWNSVGVFSALSEDFMKPVVDVVEKVLNETSIQVIVYSGQLDLICATPGTMEWVNKLNWHGKEQFAAAKRQSFVANGYIEGYRRRFENLNVYWVKIYIEVFKI